VKAVSSDASSLARRIGARLRDVPDFPKPGILFKDITPLLADAPLLRDVVSALGEPFRTAGITHVAGIESRGFILAAPVAVALGAGFIPIRKPGKLPWQTVAREYALEYGTNQLELHADACTTGARVLLVDDVLATGGTAAAAASLVEEIGGAVVGCAFLLALGALDGASRLPGRKIHTLAVV
jgi:adenine phosphoribosyltransferase